MTDILGSGLSFPLGVDRRGEIALVSDEADVKQAVAIILATTPGERAMRPEFGCEVNNFSFESIDAAMTGRVETEVKRSLERWEPRIDVENVDFDLEGVADGVLIVEITYRVLATNQLRNLVYPFYMIPTEETA